ncbi:unnamed protein product, partial [Oppiella nova]
YGVEEVLITHPDRPPHVDPAQHWADALIKSKCITNLSALQTAINIRTMFMQHLVDEVKVLDSVFEKVIASTKPDVIVLDQMKAIPAVLLSGIPWVATCSFNPLIFLGDEVTPPPNSGLPASGPVSEWKAFTETTNSAQYPVWKAFDEWVQSKGLPPLAKDRFIYDSPYLNIYGYPLELDYLDIRPLPPKWYRFDNLKRTEQQQKFEIPVPLRGRPGKLVYFSMGSMGGTDLNLMKRLVTILSKSKHRFIVSKGPLHEEYDLP